MHDTLKKWLIRARTGLTALVLMGLISFTSHYFSSLAPVKETLPLAKADIIAQLIKIPLCFESNQGQTNPQVKYLTHGPGYTFYFTPQEIVMSLKRNIQDRTLASSTILKIQFVGAHSNPIMTGIDAQTCKSNYFFGNNPQQWHTDIPNYGKVLYSDIYPGVNAVFYGNPQQLEYDICIAPGSNPQQARLHIEGAQDLSVDFEGNLHILTEDKQDVQMQKPFVYQMIENNQIPIEGNFVLLAKNEVGFDLGTYDRNQEVVIDPVLIYSTYLGGSSFDSGMGITVDNSGNAYVTGGASSLDFPVTSGAYQTTLVDAEAAFITKLNSFGSALIYSTYLGGTVASSFTTEGHSIAIDSSENAYVIGSTNSPNFPVTAGAYQTTLASGATNVFITKLNGAGSALLYSTYLGGNADDEGNSIALDSSDDVYVTGSTNSTNFPVTPTALKSTLVSGDTDAFVSKLTLAGTGLGDLLYSTYLGGTVAPDTVIYNAGSSITVDTSGNAYVTGTTVCSNFPTTIGAYQTTLGLTGPNAGQNAFITKLNPAGTGTPLDPILVYSTYLGQTAQVTANSIAIDTGGNAYVTGQTNEGFPTTTGAFQESINPNALNAFITKLNSTGSTLVYSTYLGGSNFDMGNGIAVDTTGNAYIIGATQSIDFPTSADAFQPALTGNSNAFFTVIDPIGSNLIYSTYLGGSDSDGGTSIAIDTSGNAYLTGSTNSFNFPTTANAFQSALGSTVASANAFISKFLFSPPIVTAISPSFGPMSGGTFVTITGHNFANATSVQFGSTTVPFIIDSDSQIRAYSAPGTGTVDVTVTSPLGTSATSTADLFTYQQTTSLTLTSSANPSTFGQPVTLTATLSSTSATGTVTFFDGTTLLGSSPVAAGSIATLVVNDFTVGCHALEAIYSGDGAFSGSTSAPFSQTVTATLTTVALTATPNPSTVGQSVTLTANLTPPTATGTVNFFDGTTLLGNSPVGAGGIATLVVNDFTVGCHALEAIYSGDGTFSGSTSAPFSQTVTATLTTVALTATPNPSAFGQPVALTATLSSTSATGTVTFFDGTTLLGSSPVAAGGIATLVVNDFTVGCHALEAIYSGDGTFSGSTSAPFSQTVTATLTTVALTAMPNPATVGQSVTLTANLTPPTATGSVTFFDGPTALGTVGITSGTATLTVSNFTAGCHALEAIYTSDVSEFEDSSSLPLSLIVGTDILTATTTLLTVTPNPASVGQSILLTATVSPNTATGSVMFFDGSTNLGTAVLSGGIATLTVNSFTVGSHALTATYGGDSTFSSSTSPAVALVVNETTTVTLLTVTPNPAVAGQAVSLTATITPAAATGTVIFFDGSTNLGTASVIGGVATLTVNSFTVGSHALEAVYSGDTIYSGSTSRAVSLIVTSSTVATTTNLTATPNPATFGQPVTLTATVNAATATGSVTFLDGTTILGQSPLINGFAILTTSSLPIGPQSITAIYSGDSVFNSSTSSALILVVNAAASIILPPTNVLGFQRVNRFATQTNYVNILTWQPPTSGLSPVAYRIYRNEDLTRLVGEVSASDKLRFKDENRKEGKIYTYYIVSVDQLGQQSIPAQVSIKGKE